MNETYFDPAFRVLLDGVALRQDAARSVQSLSVGRELLSSDYFALALANPYPVLPWTHGEWSGVFRPGQGVEVELGYVNRLRTVFRGEMTAFRVSFPEGGAPALTVEGSSRAHQLRGEPKTRTFQNVTDRQVVEQIAREAGLAPRVRGADVLHPFLVQYNMTDWAFLHERARLSRAEVLVEGHDLVFRPPAEGEPGAFVLEYGKSRTSFEANFDPGRQFQVDDEVLVAFEHGDMRFPYVLGALWNGKDRPPPPGADGKNNVRLLRSRSGHRIEVDDTPGREKVTVFDRKGNGLVIDAGGDAITLRAAGNLTLESAGGKVLLKGQQVEIQAAGTIDVKAGPQLNLEGGVINLN